MAIALATRNLWPGKGEPTDHQLLQQACDGEQVAFETLVQRYQRALYRFVSARLDSDQAQDVVQFVLLQLYLAMPRLRESIRKNSSLPSAPSCGCGMKKSFPFLLLHIGSTFQQQQPRPTSTGHVRSCVRPSCRRKRVPRRAF